MLNCQGLSLLEFLVKNGSERSIEEGRDHMRTLRRMQEYSSYDSTGDKGQGVREKSKQLIDLLGSNDQIREEREKAKRLRGKFGG
jgi:epsin